MRKISLVISDVDGTLVKTDKSLTPRAIEAVRRLDDAGIKFSVCSARPAFGLKMIIDKLNIRLPLGGYNSGAIVQPDMTVIEQRLLAPDVAAETVGIFHEHGIGCWVFSGKEWIIIDRNGDHVDHEIHTIDTPPTVVPTFDGCFATVSKIVGASNDHDRVKACEHVMQGLLSGRATAARSQPYYCDVIPPGTDKGRLVVVLSERLGIPQEEIAVLGDMENDLQMFRQAGFAIAMGNAPPEVKSVAQATTLSNEEDGFAHAIDRFILGGEA